jgi:ADP-ribose pyrophosphatase YjhB (NUDIX family)
VEDAAIRETWEEVNLKVEVTQLLNVYSYAGYPVVVVVYLTNVIGGEPCGPWTKLSRCAHLPLKKSRGKTLRFQAPEMRSLISCDSVECRKRRQGPTFFIQAYLLGFRKFFRRYMATWRRIRSQRERNLVRRYSITLG